MMRTIVPMLSPHHETSETSGRGGTSFKGESFLFHLGSFFMLLHPICRQHHAELLLYASDAVGSVDLFEGARAGRLLETER